MMNPEGGVAGGGHQHGGARPKAPAHATPTSSGPLSVPSSFRTDLMPLYDAYFSVHTALANDDPETAVTGFDAVGKALKRVDMALLTGGAHDAWMMLSAQLEDASDKGKRATDLETARSAFLELSRGVVDLAEQFGHAAEAAYYRAFCPMVRDNRGASWLQRSKEIRNPFFGESMLTCGEIQGTYPPSDSDRGGAEQ